MNNHPAWTANNITSTIYCTVTSTAEVRLVALDLFVQVNSINYGIEEGLVSDNSEGAEVPQVQQKSIIQTDGM